MSRFHVNTLRLLNTVLTARSYHRAILFPYNYALIPKKIGLNNLKNIILHSSSYSKTSVTDSIDQVIFNLHADIRRIKRVYYSDIEFAISLLPATGANSQTHGPFLLSCCGSYLPEVSPDVRLKMLELIWDKIKSPNIECYDALLKCYTDNNFTSFNPFTVLEEIEAAKLTPSEETYYNLLLSFCQRGDIKNAAKVLHLMKNNTMSVDERFFNALILGNSRAGDIKSARGILTIMKSSDLEPSMDSYAALIQSYIERGEFNEIENLYLKAIQGVNFSNNTYVRLLKVAARLPNRQAYLQLLNWMTDSEAISLDVVNTVLEFVFSGLHEEAFLLLEKSQKNLKSVETSFGSFFIRALITANANISTAVDMCELMRQKMLNEYSFYIASEACLRQKKFSLAMLIFEKMRQKEIELRPHFFIPVIVNSFEESGLDGLVETLQQMSELKVIPDFDIIYEWVLPRLFAVTNSPEEVGKLLKQSTGISYTSGILFPVLLFLLRQRRIADAAKFSKNLKCSLKEIPLLTEALLDTLTTGKRENSVFDFKSAVPLMKFLSNSNYKDDKTDHIGHFVVNLAECLGNELPEMLDSLMQNLAKEGVCVSGTAFGILESVLRRQCPLSTNSELVYSFGNKGLQHPRDMDLEALQCHVQELSAKEMNARGALRKLFLKYCQANDKSNALKLKETFEQKYDGLSVGMKAALLGVYTRNKMVLEALQLYDEIKNNEELSKEGGLDLYKIVDLATLMINNSYVDEGIDLIRKDCNKKYSPGLSKTVIRNVIRLLEAIVSKSNDADVTKNVLELLIENSIAEPCSPIIGVLIKQRIESHNLETAVSEFVHYGMKYKITPSQLQLYYSVLGKEDLLNKVFDCCVTIRGKVEAKHALAFAKSDVNDLEGSAKIFLELGNQVKFNKIIKQCEYLSERNEFMKLRNLVKSIQMTGRNYDCSSIYRIALEATKMHGDIQNHKSIIETMQEQDLQIPLQHINHFRSYQ